MQTVAAGGEGDALEGVDYGGGVAGDGLPGDHAGEDDGHSDVEDGADDKRGNDADGNVALGVLALFGRGGDGVEADVGEEDDGAAGEDSGEAVGGERVVVGRVDEAEAEGDEEQDGSNFDSRMPRTRTTVRRRTTAKAGKSKPGCQPGAKMSLPARSWRPSGR
jgi:hypothetical protein